MMNYYSNDAYFSQRASARSEYNQGLRASLFADLRGDTILDFGCGDGALISRLQATKKIGVEIGELAVKEATARGVEVYRSIADVPAASIDVGISFHALEHVDDDVATMEGMFRALRPGGRVRIIVPGELPIRDQRGWHQNPYKHLRTWTPLSLGNLAERTGFIHIRTRFEPPPSSSRGARLIGKAYRLYIALRDNSFNVVLDAAKVS
jgi:SAM-dependent methyltransferase